MLNHFVKQGVSSTFKRRSKRRKTNQDHIWLNFVLLLLKFIRKEFSTKMYRFDGFIKTDDCRYKIAVFSLSFLTSNDNEIQTTCFYVFFPFVKYLY